MRKEVLWGLIIILVLPLISSETCYQETANISTDCGGLATGDYGLSGDWFSSDHLFDGNWATSDVPAFSAPVSLLVNYSKPTTATNDSLWTIKTSSTNNFSIAPSCWNYDDKLLFNITIFSDGSLYVTGNATPDVKGTYFENGTSAGEPAYSREDVSYWIYYGGADAWFIDVNKEDLTLFQENEGIANSTYYAIGGGATGTALVRNIPITLFYCYNSTDWIEIGSTEGLTFYEEAMYWEIPGEEPSTCSTYERAIYPLIKVGVAFMLLFPIILLSWSAYKSGKMNLSLLLMMFIIVIVGLVFLDVIFDQLASRCST